jgi:hypothetical protein
MMESLRAWLLSLAGAALLTALAAMFPTSESLRRVVKLIGGVALTCLLFSPLVAFDYDSYAAALQDCRVSVSTDGAVSDSSERLQRTVIESQLRAYIGQSRAVRRFTRRCAGHAAVEHRRLLVSVCRPAGHVGGGGKQPSGADH